MNILPQKGKRNKPRPADGVYSFSDGQRPCYNLHSSQVGRLRPTLLLPTSARKGQAGGLQTIYRSDVPYNQCQDKKSHCPSIKIFFRHLFRPACVKGGVPRLRARVTFGRSPKSDQKVCLKPKVSRLPARYACDYRRICTARSRGFFFVVRSKGSSLRLRRCR